MTEKEIIELIARLPEIAEVGQSYITYLYVIFFSKLVAILSFIGVTLFIVYLAVTAKLDEEKGK